MGSIHHEGHHTELQFSQSDDLSVEFQEPKALTEIRAAALLKNGKNQVSAIVDIERMILLEYG